MMLKLSKGLESDILFITKNPKYIWILEREVIRSIRKAKEQIITLIIDDYIHQKISETEFKKKLYYEPSAELKSKRKQATKEKAENNYSIWQINKKQYKKIMGKNPSKELEVLRIKSRENFKFVMSTELWR